MELIKYSRVGGRLDNLTPTCVFKTLYSESKEEKNLTLLMGGKSNGSKDCSTIC